MIRAKGGASPEWDRLAAMFDTRHPDDAECRAGAQQNVKIVYPVVLRILSELRRMSEVSPRRMRVVDFGCGTGALCEALADLNYDVIGVDSATEMIAIARKKSSGRPLFLLGDASVVSPSTRADVIVSVMVVHFIQHLLPSLVALRAGLRPGGTLLFAVHNPAYVLTCLRRGVRFSDFQDPQHPERGLLEFLPGIRVPVFNRSVSDYDELMAGLSFMKVRELFLPLPTDKPIRYTAHTKVVIDEPKYLVMQYRKDS